MATVKPILKVNKDGSKDSWKNLSEVLADKNIDGIQRIFVTADGNTSAKINLSQSDSGDDWIKVYDDKLVKCEFTVRADNGKIKPILKVNKDGSKDSWKNLSEVLADKNIDGIQRIFVTADGNTSAKINLSQSSTGDDWIKVYDDKLVKCEFTFTVPQKSEPEEPDSGKILWQSEGRWDQKRILKAGQTDQKDPKLKLLKVGDILPEAIIESGECEVSGSSPRLYIEVPNKDVEFSAQVRVEGGVEIAHLIARSRHEDKPKHTKFGGYYLYANFKDQKLYFKKEESHNKKYTDRIPDPGTPIIFEKRKWYPMKISVKNIADGKVQINGDFNGTKISLIDDGTLVNTPKNKPKVVKGPAFAGEGRWCFIRTNSPNDTTSTKIKYRKVIIKQI